MTHTKRVLYSTVHHQQQNNIIIKLKLGSPHLRCHLNIILLKLTPSTVGQALSLNIKSNFLILALCYPFTSEIAVEKNKFLCPRKGLLFKRFLVNKTISVQKSLFWVEIVF